MQQQPSEDDPDRQLQLAQLALARCSEEQMFPLHALLNDDPLSMSRWEQTEFHLCQSITDMAVMLIPVIMCCGIWGTWIVGPVSVNTKLTGEWYVNILHENVFLSLLNPEWNFLSFFLQDDETPHYVAEARG